MALKASTSRSTTGLLDYNGVPIGATPATNGNMFETVLNLQPNIQVPFKDIAYDSDHLDASSHVFEPAQASIDPALLMASPVRPCARRSPEGQVVTAANSLMQSSQYSIGIEQVSLFSNLSPSEYEVKSSDRPRLASPGSAHVPTFTKNETLPSDGPAPAPRPLSGQCLDPPSPNMPISAGTPSIAPHTPSPPRKDRDPCTRSVSPSDARYACEVCGIFSKTRRDHKRHLNTNKHKSNMTRGAPSAGPSDTGVHCPVTGCKFHRATSGGRTLSREDNLWRHIKKAHGMEMSG